MAATPPSTLLPPLAVVEFRSQRQSVWGSIYHIYTRHDKSISDRSTTTRRSGDSQRFPHVGIAVGGDDQNQLNKKKRSSSRDFAFETWDVLWYVDYILYIVSVKLGTLFNSRNENCKKVSSSEEAKPILADDIMDQILDLAVSSVHHSKPSFHPLWATKERTRVALVVYPVNDPLPHALLSQRRAGIPPLSTALGGRTAAAQEHRAAPSSGAPPRPTRLELMVFTVEEAFPCMGRGGGGSLQLPQPAVSAEQQGEAGPGSPKRTVTGPQRQQMKAPLCAQLRQQLPANDGGRGEPLAG
ncbi:hypothetical protein UY3_15984 [Chelonia mydas]|uniref:Uncharacterized protein n=1 Tax=Chelonia mydas TaxID=8469 RepID=M7BFA5_CHEMY|nr:hypothetical protein UY3_15984 [Chelonia mydas]